MNKRFNGLRLTVLALAAGLALSAHALQPEVPTPVPALSPDATDRLIVKYRHHTGSDVIDAATLASAQQAASRAGSAVKHMRRTGDGSHVLRLNQRMSLERVRQLAAEIKAADPEVEYAEPDRIMRIQLVPNDPSYTAQWNYYEPAGGLNLPSAWDKSTGVGVVVAVIDTGYRPHADLAANILPGYDFITSAVVGNDGNGRDADASDPGDGVNAGECGTGQLAQNSSWHGTHVSGTIAGLTNNGVGVSGIAFGAKVLPVRVLGKCGGFTSDIADAIIWASGGTVPGVPANLTPARVINMSLGGSGACDAASQNAISTARSRGTVVVVAAGNSNANASNASPANCSGVVAVGAVGRTGARSYYSNFGTLVDVSAPGGDQSTGTANGILSTLNTGTRAPGADSYAYYQGTSMATPHVAGVAALMLSVKPSLTPDQVEAMLKSSARPLPVACSLGCGAGIVDANAAVNAALGVTPPPPPPAPSVGTLTELEPNNSLAAAQVLTGAVTINGSMSTATDTDYYRISIAAGKSVVISLTPNASSDYDLSAYNSAGTRIATSINGKGAVDSITLTNSSTTTAATAYARVIHFSGGVGAASGSYTLKVQ